MNKEIILVAIFILSFVSLAIFVNAYTIQDFANYFSQFFSNNQNATIGGFNFFNWIQNSFNSQLLSQPICCDSYGDICDSCSEMGCTHANCGSASTSSSPTSSSSSPTSSSSSPSGTCCCADNPSCTNAVWESKPSGMSCQNVCYNSEGYYCSSSSCSGGGLTCQTGQCGTYPNCKTADCQGNKCGPDPVCGTKNCGSCVSGDVCSNGQCTPIQQQCNANGGNCRNGPCYVGETEVSGGCIYPLRCCMVGGCTNDCTQAQLNSIQCTDGSIAYQKCQLGSDGCRHWNTYSCPSGQVCSSTSSSQPPCVNGNPTTQCTSTGSVYVNGFCRDVTGLTEQNYCSDQDSLIIFTCGGNGGNYCVSQSKSCSQQCGGTGGRCINGACACSAQLCTSANEKINCASYNSADGCTVGKCINSQCQASYIASRTSCNNGQGTCDGKGTCVSLANNCISITGPGTCPSNCLPSKGCQCNCNGDVKTIAPGAACCPVTTEDCSSKDTTKTCTSAFSLPYATTTSYVCSSGQGTLTSCNKGQCVSQTTSQFCLWGCTNGACKPSPVAHVGSSTVLQFNTPPNAQVLSIFLGSPVANGIYVDDKTSITITPVQSGNITMITFVFGNNIQVAFNKISVS